jgi:hypothetical protein
VELLALEAPLEEVEL